VKGEKFTANKRTLDRGKKMTDSKDIPEDPSLAISQDRAPLPQKPSSRRCQMFCKPSKDGEPMKIDYYLTHESQRGKPPEELYEEGISELTGSENSDLAKEIIARAASAMYSSNEYYERKNLVLQSLSEQKPKDVHEARLCAQATMLYSQGMDFMYQMSQSRQLPQSEFYMKNAMKLLRLHNETIEAINKHRRGGEQRVVVQHVQVNDGGKAIVSNNIELSGGK
jgi:hypothetical protein